MGKPIIPQRRGKGSMTYRAPSHRHKGVPGYPRNYTGEGKVLDIFHAPGRSAPMAKVAFGDKTTLLLVPEGLRVNQTVNIGSGASIEMGNILPIQEIPEGTLIHNVEGVPGDGGKYVRTAGTSATVITRGNKVILQMPSGSFKSFDGRCMATVGILANSLHEGRQQVLQLPQQGQEEQEGEGCGDERMQPPPRRRRPPACRYPEHSFLPRASRPKGRKALSQAQKTEEED